MSKLSGLIASALLGLAACGSMQPSMEASVESDGLQIETDTAARQSPAPAPGCVRSDIEVRSCLAQCERELRRPAISRCSRCAAADHVCEESCQMMEETQRDREDTRCREECTTPPRRCR
jgi:hypothetical protein